MKEGDEVRWRDIYGGEGGYLWVVYIKKKVSSWLRGRSGELLILEIEM